MFYFLLNKFTYCCLIKPTFLRHYWKFCLSLSLFLEKQFSLCSWVLLNTVHFSLQLTKYLFSKTLQLSVSLFPDPETISFRRYLLIQEASHLSSAGALLQCSLRALSTFVATSHLMHTTSFLLHPAIF